MLLAVDIGNTQTHLGAFDGESLVEHWRFQTRAGATGDELAERIGGLLALCEMSLARPRRGLRLLGRAAARHPVRAADRALPRGRLPPRRPGVKTGMPIRIDNPLEVGADRLVNAVAAYDRIGGACVVVDFGTGINFDAVSADGEYLGGAIAPGLEISLTRPDRTRRADPPDRTGRAGGGDRPLQPRRDPVGRRLRLRRPDRRRRPPDRGRARRGALPRHRRPRLGRSSPSPRRSTRSTTCSP